MLFLLLQIGQDRYGLAADHIVEIVPLVSLKKIPQAPPGVAGIFNYHGTLVPVIDLSELAIGRPSETNLGTRMVLVNYPMAAEKTNVLALMAEEATETIQLDPEAFEDPGVAVTETPYLGPIVRDARGLIQRLNVEKLIPDGLRDRLFNPVEEHV